MRNKNISFLMGICCCLLLFQGCIDDKGNYDYKSREEMIKVKIANIPVSTYYTGDDVHIVPGIDFGDTKPEDYEYLWYAYEDANTVGTSIVLGQTRELDYKMDLRMNTPYRLVFQVTHKATRVTVKSYSYISAVSPISEGWFVLKDKDGFTEIDMIPLNGDMHENILNGMSEVQMKGKAVGFSFQYSYSYRDEEGDFVNDAQVFHVLSEEDYRTFEGGYMQQIKNAREQFIYQPDRIRPNFIVTKSGMPTGALLINDGKIHNFSGWEDHTSQYGMGKFGANNLFPGIIAMNRAYLYGLLYDQDIQTFLTIDGENIQIYLDEIENVGMEMKWMVTNEIYYTVTTGWSLLYDEAEEGYYLYKHELDLYGSFPIAGVMPVGADRGLVNSDVQAGFRRAGQYILFGKDNVLSFYHVVSEDEEDENYEEVLFTFPAGEKISHISHIDDLDGTYKLAVLTSVGGKWKLYLFDVTNLYRPVLNTSDYEVYTGDGNPCQVIYRSLAMDIDE